MWFRRDKNNGGLLQQLNTTQWKVIVAQRNTLRWLNEKTLWLSPPCEATTCCLHTESLFGIWIKAKILSKESWRRLWFVIVSPSRPWKNTWTGGSSSRKVLLLVYHQTRSLLWQYLQSWFSPPVWAKIIENSHGQGRRYRTGNPGSCLGPREFRWPPGGRLNLLFNLLTKEQNKGVPLRLVITKVNWDTWEEVRKGNRLTFILNKSPVNGMLLK